MAQHLKIYQSLWAMEQRIPGVPEATPQTHLERIAEAGYNGACLDPNVSEIPDSLKLKSVFSDLGLECMVNAFPHSEATLEPLLDMAATLNATQVNIIAQVMPLKAEDAAEIIDRWLSLARTYPFPVLMETHRNSTLNDLFYTLEVLNLVPDLRLCADLSHFVVDRELQLPLAEPDKGYFDRVIERSDSFQGRISNNQQVQIALEFEQHAEWVAQFLRWWEDGIAGWSARNDAHATLRFLVELGPPPYAITDAQQRELSDRWQEGLLIREWVEAIWERTQASQA